MKVVFLDFDGPIIPLMSHTNKRGQMEKAWPPCVAALNRITDTTGARIVVSSSWRRHGAEGLAWLRTLLKNWGVTGDVVSATPKLSGLQGDIWVSRERGYEIQAWLDKHPNVESFVILDDDEDMTHLMHRLIVTPFEVGLTEADADKVIAMLTKNPT